MSTFPGASHQLTPAALDEDLIRYASVTFLEGYLWGPEGPRAAMLKAAAIAHSAARTVAFTLSESLCIGDRRQGVLRMIETKMLDVLFGNEHEIRHLTGCEDLADSIAALSNDLKTLVITRGAEGAIAVEGQEKIAIPAARVERVIDTTGAGDLFAAGFLAARCRGRGLSACLDAGSIAAAEVISHFGARPEANLKELTGL